MKCNNRCNKTATRCNKTGLRGSAFWQIESASANKCNNRKGLVTPLVTGKTIGTLRDVTSVTTVTKNLRNSNIRVYMII